MDYFISDLHLWHDHVLSFDNRPFKDLDEMHATIVGNWNSVVDDYDDVYFLGDLSFAGYEKTKEVVDELHGRIHLILGNHDRKILKSKLRERFVEICEYKQLDIDSNTSVILCHYPMPTFKNMYRGWHHLYGHVHNSFEHNMMNRVKNELKDLYAKKDGKKPEDVCSMHNVGCMMPYMNYTPRTLDYILENDL